MTHPGKLIENVDTFTPLENKFNSLVSSPVRYVLKNHFFIESGLKMIQFKIQLKKKSKIFIQKNYSFF